jgi:hypothetical protein
MTEERLPCVLRVLFFVGLLQLGACNSQSTAQDTLDPNAIAAPDVLASANLGTAAVPGARTSQNGASSPGAEAQPGSAPMVAGLPANTRINFATMVGTTPDAASSLSGQLLSRARERGIQTVANADPSATHLLKGYFTPLVEGKETTVIYVWDIYDASGNRIHRISGQQKAASKGGEGWGAVPPATIQAIANATVDQLAAWLAAPRG